MFTLDGNSVKRIGFFPYSLLILVHVADDCANR